MFGLLAMMKGLNLIPWRVIVMGLATLAVVLTIWLSYRYVTNLQQELVETHAALETEKVKTALQQDSINLLTKEIENTVKRFQALDHKQRESSQAWNEEREKLEAIKDCPNDQSEPSKAPEQHGENDNADDFAAELTRLNAGTNRMLERVTE